MKAGQLDARLASSLVRDIDAFADKIQVSAFGSDKFAAFKTKVSKVIQRDSDEKFMDTFDNPNKPIQTDSDEPFMKSVGPSFNSKAIDTFDEDNSSAVADRDEYAVRDLNEYAGGTKKQPSWSKGPAGKSTKQGSTPAQVPAKARAKAWAP